MAFNVRRTVGVWLAVVVLGVGVTCGFLIGHVSRAARDLKVQAVDSGPSVTRIEDLVSADLSLVQARNCFEGKSSSDLQNMFGALGSDFWSTHRNRTLVLRAMVECSAGQEGPRAAVERFLALLAPNVTDRNRLIRIIGSAAFVSNRPSVNAVTRAFAGIASEIQTELLIGVAEARKQTARASDAYDFLVACAERLEIAVSVKERSRFLLVGLRRTCYSGALDHKDLLTLLGSETLKSARSSILPKVLSEIATSLPGALPALLGTLVQEHPGLIAEQGILLEVPPELLRFALSSMSQEQRVNLLKRHAAGLLTQSPLQAVQFAREFEPHQLSPEARVSVARALLMSGGEELRSWIEGLSIADKRDVLRGTSWSSLVEAWLLGARRSPAALPEMSRAWLVASQGMSDLSEDALKEAIASAVEQLAPEQFSQVTSLVPETLRRDAEELAWRTFCSRADSNAPQEISALVDAYAKDAADRTRLLRIAAVAIASREPAQGVSWLHEFPEDQQLQESVRATLLTHPTFPLQERSHILIESINRVSEDVANPELLSGAERLMADYLQTDYTKAVGLLDKIENSMVRESLTTALVKRWASADPVTASEWIANMPAGSVGDSALREFVIACKDDPEIALKNATAITNPEMRVEAAKKVIGAWKGGDTGTLITFLKTANFLESEREALEKEIQTSRPR